MAHTPHELSDEFPDRVDDIRKLKESDPHFARLLEEYHDVNRAIHRAETNVEPTTEEHESEMRRSRMQLKDEIARMLAAIGA